MTCPTVGDNTEKSVLIPRKLAWVMPGKGSRKAQTEGLAAHQVLGRVRAYQADDG